MRCNIGRLLRRRRGVDRDDHAARRLDGERRAAPLHAIRRVHRTAIVNIERIKELQQLFGREYNVVLTDGARIPVSRSYRDKLKAALQSQL